MSAGESSGCTKLIGDLRKALSGEDAAKPAAVNRCAADEPWSARSTDFDPRGAIAVPAAQGA
jgi:hypothetical protein